VRTNSKRWEYETRRIQWRQAILAYPAGVAKLAALVRAKVKEHDLGPHRYPGLLDEVKEAEGDAS